MLKEEAPGMTHAAWPLVTQLWLEYPTPLIGSYFECLGPQLVALFWGDSKDFES